MSRKGNTIQIRNSTTDFLVFTKQNSEDGIVNRSIVHLFVFMMKRFGYLKEGLHSFLIAVLIMCHCI